MLNKITNLVKQMSDDEKTELWQWIQSKYALGEKQGMLRDDIKDKLIQLIQVEFDGTQLIEEKSRLDIFEIDPLDVISLANEIENEFDIQYINPDHISKWETVKDIVSFIETTLEDKEPYINGFEVEA